MSASGGDDALKLDVETGALRPRLETGGELGARATRAGSGDGHAAKRGVRFCFSSTRQKENELETGQPRRSLLF